MLGIFSCSELSVEQMPDISPPGICMEVAYPGASPEAVEREVFGMLPLALALNQGGDPGVDARQLRLIPPGPGRCAGGVLVSFASAALQ